MATWLRRLDRRRKLYLAPFQWSWLIQEVGLTTEECEQAAWAVTPDGTRYRGAAAISIAVDHLIGWPPIFYTIYRLPLIRGVADYFYQWVADHRSRFPGTTPAVDQLHPWQPYRRRAQE
ncbi:MAG: DCC1-like thiol-disulfide oxidoreductase family protein [Caldilineaceae bacterium]